MLRLISAQRVYAQPGETVEVQWGGYFQRDNDDMVHVVYRDNKVLAYNIKRSH